MDGRLQPVSTQTVASFATYGDARRALDLLADERFPVGNLRIVADDLRFEEQVGGPRALTQVGFQAAPLGAGVGAMLGLSFGMLELGRPLVRPIALAVWGALLGLGLGVAFRAGSYAMRGRRRAFSSVARYTAGRFRLLADHASAEHARRMLAGMQR